jgi:hypothetical protein
MVMGCVGYGQSINVRLSLVEHGPAAVTSVANKVVVSTTVSEGELEMDWVTEKDVEAVMELVKADWVRVTVPNVAERDEVNDTLVVLVIDSSSVGVVVFPVSVRDMEALNVEVVEKLGVPTVSV